jgi:hypothetical protein
MPAPKRQPIAPTDDWQQLQLLVDWPEQLTYELIRPVVLFGRAIAQRARETGGAVRTIRRKANRFDRSDPTSWPRSVTSALADDPTPIRCTAFWRVAFRPQAQLVAIRRTPR